MLRYDQKTFQKENEALLCTTLGRYHLLICPSHNHKYPGKQIKTTLEIEKNQVLLRL